MRSGTKDKRHFFVTVVLVFFPLSAFVLPIPVYSTAPHDDVAQLLNSMRGPAGVAAMESMVAKLSLQHEGDIK
jgi:hypothetical protein